MKELIENLIQAQQEMSHAKASETNPAFKNSKYVPYEKLMDYVKEHLNKHGIYIQQVAHEAEGGVCVETVLHGHGSSLGSGKVFVRAEKQTPHGYGSALTYARRYSLSLATSSGADKDDDGNQAEEDHKPAKPAATKPVQKKQPPAAAPEGEYILKMGDAVLVTANTPADLYGQSRSLIPDPTNADHQAIYKSSYDSIKKASDVAEGDAKEGLQKLMNAYGGEPDGDA